MDGLPVTIRLLDPPLHEFLPNVKEETVVANCAENLGLTVNALKEQIEAMEEINPMLGLRGCRLGITRPGIIEMQTRAVLEAALNSIDAGVDAKPDIMVPLVGKVEEFRNQRDLIKAVAGTVFEEKSKSCNYKIGTMIEIPRAALTAHEIAEEADFFSFGSNDLTVSSKVPFIHCSSCIVHTTQKKRMLNISNDFMHQLSTAINFRVFS